jgi:hypothetical protein
MMIQGKILLIASGIFIFLALGNYESNINMAIFDVLLSIFTLLLSDYSFRYLGNKSDQEAK